MRKVALRPAWRERKGAVRAASAGGDRLAAAALLALAGFAIVLRKIVELFGPEDLRAKVHEIEEAEAEHLDDVIPPELQKHDEEPR